MDGTDVGRRGEDWGLLCRYFPPGWEAAARSLGAMRRARGIRETQFLLREIVASISPRLGLAATLRAWSSIARGLCEPPRKRKRQLLG